MKIASIQPLSLSDYPPYLAAIIFTIGCNIRCSYCHNKTLWDETHSRIDSDEALSFLNNKKKKLDGVVITGGEPTIQEDLIPFAEKIKQMNYKIRLNTNGTNAESIKTLIKNNLVDYIAMDIKSSFDFYKKIHLENIKQSIELISTNNIPHEFRTVLDSNSSKNHDINFIIDMLPKNSNHVLVKDGVRPRQWTA